MMRKILLSAVCAILLMLFGCDQPEAQPRLRPDAVILAFGDSLTQGVGTRPELSYPNQLSRLIGRPVVNAGKSGEVSAAGLERLPQLLEETRPALVLICHGGNDLLRQLDRQALQDNLRRMIDAARQSGAAVVLIAVPQPGLLLEDAPLYREVAAETEALLLDKKLGSLLKERQYKSDSVHLNGQGYRRLAEAVADFLQQQGML